MANVTPDLIQSTIAILGAATDRYDVVQDDKGYREAFHEAGRGLPLVRQALQRAVIRLDGRNLAEYSKSAMDSLAECNAKAKLSESIFGAVAQAPKTSRFESYEAAVRREGKGRTVEVLVVGMMNDICALAEKFAIQDQVEGLREAIKKLSEMEPSMSRQGSGNTFSHFGSGDQYNSFGGTQNISKGSGHQFTGVTFSGPVTF